MIMAIIQEKTIRNKMGLTFEDLAHIPFVHRPADVNGITEDWFREQSEIIRKRIETYIQNPHISISDKEYKINKLQRLIDDLCKFTTSEISKRDNQNNAVIITPRNPFQEEYERQLQYNKLVDGLFEKKRQDDELSHQTEGIRQILKSQNNE